MKYIRGNGSYGLAIVGESHYQTALVRIAGPYTHAGRSVSRRAVLYLQPDNPHDRHAIQVEIDGSTVGYASRVDAPILRRELAMSGVYDGDRVEVDAVIRGGRTGQYYGVWLDLSLHHSDAYPNETEEEFVIVPDVTYLPHVGLVRDDIRIPVASAPKELLESLGYPTEKKAASVVVAEPRGQQVRGEQRDGSCAVVLVVVGLLAVGYWWLASVASAARPPAVGVTPAAMSRASSARVVDAPTLGPPQATPTFTPAPPTATATARPAHVVAVKNSNLRAGPGMGYAVVGGVRAGDAVSPMGRSVDGNWTRLRSGAWIASYLVANLPRNLPVIVTGAPAAPASSVYAGAVTTLMDAYRRELDVLLGFAPEMKTRLLMEPAVYDEQMARYAAQSSKVAGLVDQIKALSPPPRFVAYHEQLLLALADAQTFTESIALFYESPGSLSERTRDELGARFQKALAVIFQNPPVNQ